MKRISTAVAATLLGASGANFANGHAQTAGHGGASLSPIEQGLPSANPGDCFARVLIAATYDTIPQTVTTQEAFDSLNITPAQLAPETLNIKTRDEGIRYVVRQPRYETVTEEVLVRPAYEELKVLPAQFETVTETIVVGEPKLVWRPGRNLSAISRTDPETGIVYCLVEEPAETKTVSRRVVRVPGQIQTVNIPAQYKTVTKQVLVDPGGVDQSEIPAEFTDVTVSRLVSPAEHFTQAQPAQTSTIDTRRLSTPERFEWVPVLCDTNATSSAIRSIQTALTERGHFSGAIDGNAGPSTQSALTSFQRANGISHEGFLSAYTLDLLGLGHLVSNTRQPAPLSGPTHIAQRTSDRVSHTIEDSTRSFDSFDTDELAGSATLSSTQQTTVTQPSETPRVETFARPAAAAPAGRRRLTWVGKK